LTEVDRVPVTRDLDVDVAIVGAGYTGLWTAYYLTQLNPNLDIAIIEANQVGFGASGRNGGWCSALFPTSIDKLASKFGSSAARKMQIAMHETVSEIGQVVAQEKIDCDWQQGGSFVFARSKLQRDELQAEASNWHSWGFTETDYCFLTADQAAQRAKFTKNHGAFFTSHVAAIQPAKLVRQLAQVVEKLGVKIYENSSVTAIDPGMVTTHNQVVRAKYVVRATEGYTASLAGLKREIAPIYSLMLVTEPLSDEVWQQIGLTNRETFSDGRNLIIYGQRTTDNRIAFGGRGAPYHFGSKIKPEFDQVKKVHDGLKKILVELFPVLQNTSVTHTWGGPLGVPRDWMPTASFDATTGMAHAGGYVGDGVGTSNLAGRTLAHLITRTENPITQLPWVNHRSPKWEPEPFRWLGANLGLQAATFADQTEQMFGKRTVVTKVMSKLTGN
jgi:glycine/D-amino acid oxidase-like deaminating enzyme